MKRISRKRKEYIKRLSLKNRQGRTVKSRGEFLHEIKTLEIESQKRKLWIDKLLEKGLIKADIKNGKKLKLYLPKELNLNKDYGATILSFSVIRALISRDNRKKPAYKLSGVIFDEIKNISSSASLVLTAELSRWDDTIKNRLRPNTRYWSPSVFNQLKQLGFFELFSNPPSVDTKYDSNITYVKYIKGRCGDTNKLRDLKSSLRDIISKSIEKWTFLHSGLTEAITNVTHHAYPLKAKINYKHRNWYLSGAYDHNKNILKIAFYDQGIGIPKSLPASDIWEKVLYKLKGIPKLERYYDKTLIKAAVEIDRTSSGINDRGKGLQDMLEFTKQRGNGYLSIMSLKGLYKSTIIDKKEEVKTESFKRALPGTLIIWCVRL